MMLVIVVISVIAFALLNVLPKIKSKLLFHFSLVWFCLKLNSMMANLSAHFGMENHHNDYTAVSFKQ